MIGGTAILAVAGIVDDKHAVGIGGSQRVPGEQLQRARRDGIGIPRRFGKEELQLLLYGRRLRLHQWLSAD